MKKRIATFVLLTAAVTSGVAFAHHRRHQTFDANGNAGVVVSHKTGAKARVGAAYAARFQAYIDSIEAAGARVLFMGGIRRGRCSSGHRHPCGMALDVCQKSRDRVDARCRLPDRRSLARIASSVGLFEGGQWCHGDYGHAQVGVSAAPCGETRFASARRKIHHHRYRVASYRTNPKAVRVGWGWSAL